ncbi:hypothetical protein ES705_17719 [subsurface metagenome]
MASPTKNQDVDYELNALLTFIKRTKEGEFVPIQQIVLPYDRSKVETISVDVCEDNYYYIIS